MKLDRSSMKDGNGQEFLVVVEIDESGSALEKAIQRLANKARSSTHNRASALNGAVRVMLYPVKRGVS